MSLIAERPITPEEALITKQSLEVALAPLYDREKDVLLSVLVYGQKLRECGALLDSPVCGSRVQQIRDKALRKARGALYRAHLLPNGDGLYIDEARLRAAQDNALRLKAEAEAEKQKAVPFDQRDRRTVQHQHAFSVFPRRVDDPPPEAREQGEYDRCLAALDRMVSGDNCPEWALKLRADMRDRPHDLIPLLAMFYRRHKSEFGTYPS